MTVRHLLPIVLVGEAPPRGGLGPLGPFDCDSGVRLARLDQANADDLRGRDAARTRRCAERTLGLFERVNLLAEWPGPARRAPDPTRPHLAPSAADRAARGGAHGDAWPKDQAAEAWRALAPSLTGRRVVLVGRVAEAAGLRGLPPLRWLRLGGEGEPAEACCLPHPSGVNRWYNDAGNRGMVAAWLAEVRREREAAEAAWVSLGGGWAYHLAHGEWGRVVDREVDWYTFRKLLDRERGEIRDQLLAAAAKVARFGGVGRLSLLDHACLVADLCPTLGAKRLALAHDLHESPLVGDASTPLKRLMRREYSPVERVAARAVEQLLGLDPTPEERAEVAAADRLALLVEARQVGVDLGDPDAEYGYRAALARLHADRLARTHATPADWLRAWAETS